MAKQGKKISLQQFFQYGTEQNIPFAFYRLPGSEAVKVIAQKNSAIVKLDDVKDPTKTQGFVFAPFQQNKHFAGLVIRPDVFAGENTLPALNFAKGDKVVITHKHLRQKETNKTQFEKQVKQCRKAIVKGELTKVIAARVLRKKKPEGFDAVTFYKALCAAYPNAFVSLVYTPLYGLWIGASPEILLQASDGSFTTYSLAETMPKPDKKGVVKWGEKEQQEQEIVSDYIVDAFKSIIKSKPVVKGPETITAGNLLHLRTTFTYSAQPEYWYKAVQQLHPTPAVGGLPKQEAIDFILKQEKFERGFYSGYLGPVNMDKEVNLYVNLRCMQVLKNKLVIYVGCGITAGSNPEAEWRESKAKSQTLLSVLATL